MRRQAGTAWFAKAGAKGTGLIDTGAKFPSPANEGDVLRLEMTPVEWGSRTLRIEYIGYVSDRRVVEGFELRGLFIVGSAHAQVQWRRCRI